MATNNNNTVSATRGTIKRCRSTVLKQSLKSTIVSAFVLLLATCSGGTTTPVQAPTVAPTAPTPSPSATTIMLAATATTASSSTAISPPPNLTALPATATPLAPTVTPPLPTVTAAASTPATTPDVDTYNADFATWFAGAESEPFPFRAGVDPGAGEYRLVLTDARRPYVYIRYAPEGRSFADFRLDVDVRRVAGPDTGNLGVVFRAQPQEPTDRTNTRYAFVIYPNGNFALNLVRADGTAQGVAPYASTPAINTGDALNHLTVTCRGDKITLEINGQVLGTYPAAVTRAGAIGLIVGNPPNSPDPAGMGAAFSNLRVTTVP